MPTLTWTSSGSGALLQDSSRESLGEYAGDDETKAQGLGSGFGRHHASSLEDGQGHAQRACAISGSGTHGTCCCTLTRHHDSEPALPWLR